MPTERAKHIIQQFEQAESERRTFDDLFQQVSDLVLPRRDFNTARTRGQKRHNKVFDSTAIWANERLAATLHAFLTNAATPWLSLKIKDDEELNSLNSVRRWLDQIAQLLLSDFGSHRTMFESSIWELYLEEAAFGTSCMFVGDSTDDLKFMTRPLSECFIREDHRGQIDTVFRRFDWTAHQMAGFYGQERLPTKVREALDKEPNKLQPLLHVVMPNDDRNPRLKDTTNKPFSSIHIWLPGKEILLEGGFDEFPFMVPRWSKVPGENYGRSQAMTVLPDIKMLQAMSKTVLKAAQKVTDPPLMVPDDGFIGPLKTRPGGTNYFRAGSRDRIEPLVTNGRVDIGIDMMNQRREQIMRAFFIDLTQLRESDRMTATEIIDRRENRFRLMSPMISRLQTELLVPLIQRVLSIKARNGQLPPAPQVISGAGTEDVEVDIEFVSPAAVAQRATRLDNINRWLRVVLPVLELDPEAVVNIDTNQLVRVLGRLTNIPPQLMTAEEQAAAAREQMQQNQQGQQLVEQLRSGGEAVQSAAEGGQALEQALAGDQEEG